MKILTEQEFSAKKLTQTNESEPQKGQIYIDNKPTNSFIDGAILEASIQYNNFYLAFMTDDIPYEDMLHIHLLDKKLNLLDSVTIGSPYATGSFKSLEICEPNSAKFYFMGATQWIISIFPEKQLHIPLFSDPKGVSRKIKFSRYLKITGTPIPESV